jgi:hypothetical protein
MNARISPTEPQTQPGIASAEQGYVILDGPDGVAVTMTHQAAEQTAQSLHEAAQIAGRQMQDKGQGD